MGCTASKDAVETNRKSRSARRGGNMSMPVQAQGNRDNGYHMVALTSSTYGILKVEDPKLSNSTVSLSNSSDDAFHEKLKYFEIPEEMQAKSWSEVRRYLPEIPPLTKTDNPLRTDSLRRMDSPRSQTRGLDSPRQNMGSFRGTDSPRKSMGSFRGTDSPRLRGSSQQTGSLRSLPSQVAKNDHETINTWELMDGLDENGNALGKLKLKPVERIPRSPSINPKIVAPEANDTQEGSKSHFLPSPLLVSVGTKNASVTQVTNNPPALNHSKSPTVKAVDSPMSLNSKLEAEIKRAVSEVRGVTGPQSVTNQPTTKTSVEPDSGRVRAAVISLSKEGAVAQPQLTPRRVEVDVTSDQPNRQLPRFASPIHVLSLAASFDLENRKNSMSHLDLKAAPGRKSLSNQHSMPSSSLRAIPSSGQGVGLQSQASAPHHGRYGSTDTMKVSAGSQEDNLLLDSDLLASFDEVRQTDDLQNVRGSRGETKSISGVRDINNPLPMDTRKTASGGSAEGVSYDKDGQGNGNKGANVHLAARGDIVSSKSSAAKAAAPRQIVKPDPWTRFMLKCPPDGDDRVVLYTTSLRGIRKTFEDCNNARLIFESFNIDIDERDVSIHAEFRQELKELVEKPVPVPQAFIKGRYIGGMDIITELHEDGTLATLLAGLPPQLSRGECDGCGGVRFVPCSDCNGSTKVVNEAKEVVRCTECNENGLMRCPICY